MKKPEPQLLEKYLNNQCSQEQAGQVLEWLATPEGQAYYEQYLDHRISNLDLQVNRNTHQKEGNTLENIYQRIKVEEKVKPVSIRPWYWAAASVAVLLIGSMLAYAIYGFDQQYIETAYGETRTLELLDGTVVVMNANSTLSYNEYKPREVWLKGEAFFEVFHTSNDAPFKVHTSDLTVNVLGTEFNVNTRHTKTDVVLKKGKVVVNLENNFKKQELFMRPGDKVSFSQQSGSLEKKVVNPEMYAQWKEGVLTFDHTPLREVFQLIRDVYGVKVEVADEKIYDKEISGKVKQDIKIMVTLIEKSFNLKAELKEETIYLK